MFLLCMFLFINSHLFKAKERYSFIIILVVVVDFFGFLHANCCFLFFSCIGIGREHDLESDRSECLLLRSSPNLIIGL